MPMTIEPPMPGHRRRCRTGGPNRIRSWRAETIAGCAPGAALQTDADGVFGAPSLSALSELARQLRRERVLGQGRGQGYDLGRHAMLARTLHEAGANKKRRPDDRAAPGDISGAGGLSGPCGGAAGRGPSAWRAASGQPHSSGQPSDNRPAGPTSRGNPPARDCTGCADGASAT
jgi:hypothetical protein